MAPVQSWHGPSVCGQAVKQAAVTATHCSCWLSCGWGGGGGMGRGQGMQMPGVEARHADACCRAPPKQLNSGRSQPASSRPIWSFPESAKKGGGSRKPHNIEKGYSEKGIHPYHCLREKKLAPPLGLLSNSATTFWRLAILIRSFALHFIVPLFHTIIFYYVNQEHLWICFCNWSTGMFYSYQFLWFTCISFTCISSVLPLCTYTLLKI